MANEIRTKLDAWADFTITLASLPIGGGRQSTILANGNNRPAALVLLRISPNVAPTAGTVYEVYLIRGDGTGNRTDLAGAADAILAPVNAQLLGVLVSNGTTDVEDIFDTAPLGPLGTEWGIIVKNATNQTIDAVEANHIKRYATYLPEIQ